VSEEIAPRREMFSVPVSYLPRQIREPVNAVQALGIAWLLTFPLSIALAALAGSLFPEAQQPQFDITGATALFLLVVFAPVLETLIMGGALLILLRLFSPTVAILLSSLGWGIAHTLQAPTWGLVIWWPFLIFSTLFVVWRQRSLAAAFAMPALAHALHNLPTAALIASGIKV